MEICVDGVWGTICGDSWDAMGALVACRQMGIPATSKLLFDLIPAWIVTFECCDHRCTSENVWSWQQ